jgi:hypothetical protein
VAPALAGAPGGGLHRTLEWRSVIHAGAPPMRLVLLLASLALVAAPIVHAQGKDGEVPRHACKKPGEFPNPKLASDQQLRNYHRDYTAYTDCIRKFAIDEQKAAEPHIKASNEAINEYNAAVKAYNDELERRKAGK